MQPGCGAAPIRWARGERDSSEGVRHDAAADCDERRKEECDGDRGTDDERAGAGEAAEAGVKVKEKARALVGGRGITVGTAMSVVSQRKSRWTKVSEQRSVGMVMAVAVGMMMEGFLLEVCWKFLNLRNIG